MNFLNLAKNILLKSQFYVSFCAILLGIFVLQEQESYHFSLTMVLFLTFWSGYLFTVFHKKKDAILINVVGFILISFLIFRYFNIEFYIKWLIVLFLGFIYNADFLNINLREFSVIKTFYVGLVWAMSLVWLPLEHFNWSWFFIIFFFISAITFPFEIRDLERDQFITLPKKIGIRNTKFLSYLFLILSAILAFNTLKTDYAFAFLGTCIFAAGLVYFSSKKQKDWYYSFLIESLSALPFLILILIK
jgi:4-hydroxybenzoate polyprenyltransferase